MSLILLKQKREWRRTLALKCECRQLNSLSGGWQETSIFSAKADCSWHDFFHLIIRKNQSFTAHLWSCIKNLKPPVSVESKHSQKSKVASIYKYPVVLVQVECGSKDLHSGTFGGIIHEPLLDLIALLGKNTRHCWGAAGEHCPWSASQRSGPCLIVVRQVSLKKDPQLSKPQHSYSGGSWGRECPQQIQDLRYVKLMSVTHQLRTFKDCWSL